MLVSAYINVTMQADRYVSIRYKLVCLISLFEVFNISLTLGCLPLRIQDISLLTRLQLLGDFFFSFAFSAVYLPYLVHT